MRRQSTATRGGNDAYYCNKCGVLWRYCTCHLDLEPDENLNPSREKFKKEFMCDPTQNVPKPPVVRRTPHHISGMKGISLLKKVRKI